MFSFLLFLVISIILDLVSLNSILLSFAHFSILARSEFANTSASGRVLPFVMIATSSAKAITFV